MVRKKKGQVAIEYILLIGFIMFSTVIIVFLIGTQILNVQNQNNEQTAKNIRDIIMQHVHLAEITGDGFKSTFSLVKNVEGLEYSLEISGSQSEMLIVEFASHESSYYISSNSAGQFCFDESERRYNIAVRNVGGVIELSSCLDCTLSYQYCEEVDSDDECSDLSDDQLQQCQKYCLCE